ncbi:MAG: hypothetical protein FWD68_04555 [Alphaproteobacteria bacterium]|nr:hypothetical protein [Alphaproteobacteria bacterium]
MVLGEFIRDLSQKGRADAFLALCPDLTLLARLDAAAGVAEETVGEYVESAVRRFANQAGDEDWLALVNATSRERDPGRSCLTLMLAWALRQDEARNEGPVGAI